MSEHGTVERIVTELKLLQNWHTVKSATERSGFPQPTVSEDIKDLDRLGLLIKRDGERKGARGKVPIEYRLKPEERVELTKAEGNFITNVLRIIQTFGENRRVGLRVAELSEKSGVPIASCNRVMKALKETNWLYRDGLGPVASRPYKPRFKLVRLR